MAGNQPIRKAARKARGAVQFGVGRLPGMVADSVRDARRDTTNSKPTKHEHDLRELAHADFAAAWLGHGGVLLRQGGTTILIDPVLSDRIGPRIGGRTIGPARLASAPAAVGELPAIDLVLISHAHYDHLDRPTLEQLARSGTTLITSRRTKRLIPRGFGRVIELGLDDDLEIEGLRIAALRPEHWGGRTAVDVARGCNSYLIESNDRRTLAPGDTALTTEFDSVGAVDLAVFGIGAYEPSEHHHATPEQVWQMFTAMPGRVLLPVHHSTFDISGEHIDEPIARLLQAAGDHAAQVAAVKPGELWVPGEG
ncbi:MAG: MBL fold metallo-hydrolase [Planctomycetota bacterium]|nr:MBL fold metallo-hydrolase [Planctomycetota bacterium]